MTWSSWSSTAITGRDWRDLRYNGSEFIAVAYGSAIAIRSTDGISWTEYALPNSRDWNGVHWTGSKWIAIAFVDTYVATSTDGTSWTEYNVGETQSWLCIMQEGDGSGTHRLALMGAGETSVRISTNNGESWSAGTAGASNGAYSAARNGSISQAGVALNAAVGRQSTDGWDASRVATTLQYAGSIIVWDETNSVYVSKAASGTGTQYSSDGVTWTAGGAVSSGAGYNTAMFYSSFDGMVYYIPNNTDEIWYTSDGGINWTESSNLMPSSRKWRANASSGNMQVSLPSDATLAFVYYRTFEAIATDSLDLKMFVQASFADMLDAKVAPFTIKTNYLDNKVAVISSKIDLLDLKIESAQSFLYTDDLHAKVIIGDVTTDYLDGKVVTANNDIDLFDFKLIAAIENEDKLDLYVAASTQTVPQFDIKLTVGNTNLLIIKRSVSGFATSATVQYRITNTITQTTTTDWTSNGVKERSIGGGISQYFVMLVFDESNDSVEFDIDWNEAGTNKYAVESINLQDLFSLKAIMHLENETITDPTTGKQKIMKRDSVTVYKEADITEDVAGAIPYDDDSSEINRRTKFIDPS